MEEAEAEARAERQKGEKARAHPAAAARRASPCFPDGDACLTVTSAPPPPPHPPSPPLQARTELWQRLKKQAVKQAAEARQLQAS